MDCGSGATTIGAVAGAADHAPAFAAATGFEMGRSHWDLAISDAPLVDIYRNQVVFHLCV